MGVDEVEVEVEKEKGEVEKEEVELARVDQLYSSPLQSGSL